MTIAERADGHHKLLASWPDLPERANHAVARFEELKLAVGCAERPWRCLARTDGTAWIRLLRRSVSCRASPPRRPTEPARARQQVPCSVTRQCDEPRATGARSSGPIPNQDETPAPARSTQGGFSERVRLGNLGPLLWA